jgi:hypothetical protein
MLVLEWKDTDKYSRLYVRDGDDLDIGWPVCILARFDDKNWSFDIGPGSTEACPWTLNCDPINFGDHTYEALDNAKLIAEEQVKQHLLRKEKK